MKFKIFTLLLIIALVVLGYFAYPIVKKRYFPNNTQQSETTEEEKSSPMDNVSEEPTNDDRMLNSDKNISELSDSEKNFLSGKKTEATEPNSTINANERNASGKTLARITTAHCNSDCDAFSIDLRLLEYCQQVCGIAPIKEVSGCDDKKDLQKDYCLKDLAVSKKDASICKQIEDANIELTCKNRIIQDVLEGN